MYLFHLYFSHYGQHCQQNIEDNYLDSHFEFFSLCNGTAPFKLLLFTKWARKSMTMQWIYPEIWLKHGASEHPTNLQWGKKYRRACSLHDCLAYWGNFFRLYLWVCFVFSWKFCNIFEAVVWKHNILFAIDFCDDDSVPEVPLQLSLHVCEAEWLQITII